MTFISHTALSDCEATVNWNWAVMRFPSRLFLQMKAVAEGVISIVARSSKVTRLAFFPATAFEVTICP